MMTAEEFLQDTVIENNNSFDIVSDLKITSDVTKAMIEFAKMHVEAALQKANKNARIDVNGNKVIASGFRDREGNQISVSIDKHSITNAYPESNIKQMRGRRVYCEDISPVLKSIRTSKKHGKTVEINGLQYEHIGDDMLYCLKTSTIKKA